MAESLESFKSYIGKRETASDVVTASAMLKFAATLGQENPPMEKGAPIPPGWYGGFFPASHRPSQMRTDGQASGGGIVPPIPLPRRRIGGTRVSFQEPLRIGDEITRVTEIADVRIDDGSNGAMVTVIERNSISNGRGLALVEERDMVMLSEARAEAAPSAVPTIPAQLGWRRSSQIHLCCFAFRRSVSILIASTMTAITSPRSKSFPAWWCKARWSHSC
jgi:3-methylfumaryl-CoA hydratase